MAENGFLAERGQRRVPDLEQGDGRQDRLLRHRRHAAVGEGQPAQQRLFRKCAGVNLKFETSGKKSKKL